MVFYVNYFSFIPFLFLIFSFCMNFHAAWLLYDLFLIAAFVKIIASRAARHKYLLSASLVVSLIYSLLVSVNTLSILSVLSWWDTYKHLILIYLLGDIHRFLDDVSLKRLEHLLLNVVFVTFFIQVSMVIFQSYRGVHFDNVSGFLGDGSTHSLGVMALMVLVVAYSYRLNSWLFGGAFVGFFLVNFLGENIGMFVFLIFVILLAMMSNKRSFLFILAFLALALPFLFLFGQEYFDLFRYRLMSFFNFEESSYEYTTSRGGLLLYAYQLGGWVGFGPGEFSQIYSLRGQGVDLLVNSQINISEATHLIAEYGLIGLMLMIGIYALSILHLAPNLAFGSVCFAGFVLLSFYNRLLMDERIIFFAVLMVTILKLQHVSSVHKKIRTGSDPDFSSNGV